MVRLEPGNSERRIRGNYKMGNENKLQLKFAVVVVFFKWIVFILPRFFLGRNILSQWLTLYFFWVFPSLVCLYYHLLLLKTKKQKKHYIIRFNRGPWQIHVSFQKKEHHLRRLFKTSFSFILYHSLQYHLNSMFYFSLGPMFLSAFLRDWGVISFDILTVTVMTTGSWSQLWARHWKLLCH